MVFYIWVFYVFFFFFFFFFEELYKHTDEIDTFYRQGHQIYGVGIVYKCAHAFLFWIGVYNTT